MAKSVNRLLLLLLALASFGTLRGSLAVSTGCADSLCTPIARGSIPRHGSTHSPFPDYTPTPQPGLSITLAPGETVRVLTRDQWRAIRDAFPAEQEAWAQRTMMCESGGDPAQVGAAGERGAFQIMERLHGPVPATLEAQAQHAAAVLAKNGRSIWTTSEGCESWTR